MACLLEMIAVTDAQFNIIVAEEGYTIAENRSYIVVQAHKANSKYLLFVDDDMVFTPEILNTLLSREKDVIGVPYYSRLLPRESYNAIFEDGNIVKELPEELFKCQHIGTGVMLIDMKVFKDMDLPFFNFKTHETGYTLMGEDAWFCKQARAKGYEIWCDPSLKVGHLGDYEF